MEDCIREVGSQDGCAVSGRLYRRGWEIKNPKVKVEEDEYGYRTNGIFILTRDSVNFAQVEAENRALVDIQQFWAETANLP